MVRQRLLGSIWFTLVIALLGALLVTTAGVVSAAASVVASPGTAAPSGVGGNTFFIPFTTTATDLDVNCGVPAAQCSVWVARNNAPFATEALFTNVTGSRTLIPVNFINDGCFNFRLYDSGHGALLGQMNVGHPDVCKADGTGKAVVLVNSAGNYTRGFSSGVGSPPPTSLGPFPIAWDSGFAGGVEDSQVWITQSTNQRTAFNSCADQAYPNPREVLYTQNVSGQQTDLNPLGGGPYCFALYQGTAHTTKIAGPATFATNQYLIYAGGTANPGFDNAQGTVYFNSAIGGISALVCVYGTAIPGSSVANQTPFAFNSQGYDRKVASFQTSNNAFVTSVTYTLFTGVTNLAGDGSATAASCGTGTKWFSFTVAT